MVERLEILSSKLRKALAQLPQLFRALRMVWQVAQPWTIAWFVLLLIQGLLPAAGVYLMRLVVNGFVGAVKTGAAWPQIRSVLGLVVALGGVMALMEVARATLSWIRTVQAELLQDHINALIHAKSVS